MALGAVGAWFRTLFGGTREPLTVPAPVPTPPPPRRQGSASRADSVRTRLTLRDFLGFLERRNELVPVDAALFLTRELCDAALASERPERMRWVTSRSVFFARDGLVRANASEENPSFQAMAPEVVRGLPLSVHTDVFNTGMLLFEALHGQRPYVANGDFAQLTLARDVSLPPLGRVVPDSVQAILGRALRPVPEERYDGIPSMRADVARALGAGFDRREWLALLGPALEALSKPPLCAPETSTAHATLAQVRAGDEAARLVYADMLEEAGRKIESQWLRLEHELRTMPEPAQRAAIAQLRTLEVSPAFLASVARPDIENCGVTFGFKCPRTWNALALTAAPDVRWCDACSDTVHFATSVEHAAGLAMQGRCIAIAPGVERSPDDLEAPKHGVVGRPSAVRRRD